MVIITMVIFRLFMVIVTMVIVSMITHVVSIINVTMVTYILLLFSMDLNDSMDFVISCVQSVVKLGSYD